MSILAIDPGTAQSAWLELGTWGVPTANRAIAGNDDVLAMLWANRFDGVQRVVVESVESYGMPVGKEVFRTVLWSGRFVEAARPLPVYLLPRGAVKLHLCHSARASDANIRAALLDRFGGKEAAIGRKAEPGPLYGITTHLWAALGVAVTLYDAPELAELVL